MKKQSAYFDNASTTSVRPEVMRAMMPYFSEKFGNPSNLYGMGREAKDAIYQATKQIADALHCMPGEFVYTGSATESDNLATAGVARANKEHGNRIIISSIEHKGIMSVAEMLAKEGFEIVTVGVTGDGLIDLDDLAKQINDKTILVSITMADSETGTLQPIKKISEIIQAFRTERAATNPALATSRFPLFHTDASQSSAYANINVEKLGVDLLTLSAHKIGGPKGIGGLYYRKGTRIAPLIYGGGQQGRLRSGTENVPGIVGFGAAMALNESTKKKESVRIKKLRDALERGLFKRIPKILVNGHKTQRLPNFLNISFLDVEGEALLLHLDEHQIMINTGSACNSESLEPSYVLTALGNPYEFVHGSIRFTFGKDTTMADVDYVLKHMPAIVTELRQISPLDLSLDQKVAVSDPRAFIGNQTPHFLRKKLKSKIVKGKTTV